MTFEINGVIYDKQIVIKRVQYLTNQIYKLLPSREQGIDWKKPLSTIIEELAGMGVIINLQEILFPLLCKLQGLYTLQDAQNFSDFRRTIFECLSITGKVIDYVRTY